VLLDDLPDRSIQAALTTNSAVRRGMGRRTGLLVLATNACCSPLRYTYMMRSLPLRTRTQEDELRLCPHLHQLSSRPSAPRRAASTSCGIRGRIWTMRNAGKRKRRLEPLLRRNLSQTCATLLRAREWPDRETNYCTNTIHGLSHAGRSLQRLTPSRPHICNVAA
jgi:hypothetical protein